MTFRDLCEEDLAIYNAIADHFKSANNTASNENRVSIVYTGELSEEVICCLKGIKASIESIFVCNEGKRKKAYLLSIDMSGGQEQTENQNLYVAPTSHEMRDEIERAFGQGTVTYTTDHTPGENTLEGEIPESYFVKQFKKLWRKFVRKAKKVFKYSRP